ncbi:acyl-CoA thioester hydrolase/BAAT C-terminal domain-containing protein [Halobaculum marinum]|uniref:Acyl-CoA thioester hydrolase/BAAT C-terminal domain-containing protein n=1 Tax=Halobaculum marinum TaxID=3031996 RepID=A0ABD5WZY2_9EURY|nr:acyl-CoA thioester hydrolase/BAAT C-terminal domain-containing protein [Halobaculum sp. DT55]
MAEATTTRIARSPDARGSSVDADGLVGIVYTPDGAGPHQPVIVLHGSGGYIPREYCQLLATQGYWTLGLQYFGPEEALSDDLNGVPIAYFERAVEWVQSRPETVDDGIGLVGISRGVEPAILTAASIDTSATVVGYGGSGFLVPSTVGPDVPWTRDGDPIVSREQFDAFWSALHSTECGDWQDCSFDEPDAVCETVACVLDTVRETAENAYEAVMLPVEDIQGPVSLLTGKQDAVWNASAYSEFALYRLLRNDHDDAFGHYSFPDAGHLFLRPYHANIRGGSRSGNARAAMQSFPRVLDTLDGGIKV